MLKNKQQHMVRREAREVRVVTCLDGEDLRGTCELLWNSMKRGKWTQQMHDMQQGDGNKRIAAKWHLQAW